MLRSSVTVLVTRDWKTCDCCGTPKDRPKAMTGQSHLVLQVRSSYNQESISFVCLSPGKSLFRKPQGVSNRTKITSGAIWGGYVLLNMASGRFLTRLGSPYHPILSALGISNEPQIGAKWLLGPSVEAMFCLTWRLEGFGSALEAHTIRF